MPSPNLMGAILARQTNRVKIAVIGNALPLYNPPMRVAEEFAMLDCMSGGPADRRDGGRRRAGVLQLRHQPDHAREMFREALDLILKAWTEPGPFRCYSKHYNSLRQPLAAADAAAAPAHLDPRRRQPGDDGVRRQAALRLHGHPVFSHRCVSPRVRPVPRRLRQEGYTPEPEQMGWGVPVYVAETDKQAREEFEPRFWYFAKKLLHGIDISPPGYTSAKSALAILKNQASS